MTAGGAYRLPDESATLRLGAALGSHCPRVPAGPRILYLKGGLGAGKTTVARALLGALGHGGAVRSPSYTLVEPYAVAGFKVLHADLYRLQAPGEWRALGINDELGEDSLLLVEWPEKGEGALPPADLELELTVAGEGRNAMMAATSEAGRRWLDGAATELHGLECPSR